MTTNKQQTRQGGTSGATTAPGANDQDHAQSHAQDHVMETGSAPLPRGGQGSPAASSSVEASRRPMRQGAGRGNDFRDRDFRDHDFRGTDHRGGEYGNMERRNIPVQTVQQISGDGPLFMTMATAMGNGLLDMHRAAAELAGNVAQTNLRTALDIFRLAGPSAFVELQQRCVQGYVGILADGHAGIVRAARQTADETWRPLEEHIELRRRQLVGQQQPRAGRVGDVMSRGVRVASPEDTVQQAARMMRDENIGALPVGENDRLIGMVTDRDMATRLVAEGRDPANTRVREVMTPGVRYVFEDEDLQHAAETMSDQHVGRLPVVSREKRLVGIVSLNDLAAERAASPGEHVPGGVHSAADLHHQAAMAH